MNSKNTNYKQTEIGEIPEDWDIALLSEVAKVNEASVNKDFKYEWIEYIDVSSTLKGEILETQKLSLKDAPSRAKRIVSDNDILISTVRPNLKHFAFVSKTKPNLIASTGYAVVSSKKVNPRFLYYYLTTEEYTNYLSAIADTTTSTYPAFNPDVLERSRIPFPSENEQQQIASILTSLDDKIELNRRMNKTLEEIGKALFKRWFVDFEFPNENGEPYKSSGGEMVESELGEMPKGWKIQKLKDICTTISKGTTPRKSDVEGNSLTVSFIKVKDLSEAGDIGIDLELIPESVHKNQLRRSILEEGDLLFSIAGTIGRVAIVDKRNSSANCNQALAFIRLIEKDKYLDYIHQWIKTSFVQSTIKAQIVQGVQANVSLTVLGSLSLVLPNERVLEEWNTNISPITKKIQENKLEIQLLSSTRDSLLPRLMSGRIRV